MHVPDGYLSPSTCAVLYAAAVPFWTIALRRVAPQARTPIVPAVLVAPEVKEGRVDQSALLARIHFTVRTTPGDTMENWMFGYFSCTSVRKFAVSEFRKCFDALYAERITAMGMRPSMEEMLMMCPSPRCEKCGSTSCMPSNGGIEKCDGLDNDCDGTVDESCHCRFDDERPGLPGEHWLALGAGILLARRRGVARSAASRARGGPRRAAPGPR